MDKDYVDFALIKANEILEQTPNDESFELCQLIIGLVHHINFLEANQVVEIRR